jgi:hypothetical protein
MDTTNTIINGDKGTWGNLNETELKYKPDGSNDSTNLAMQRIQKHLGDVVKDDDDGNKIVNTREITRQNPEGKPQQNIFSYEHTKPIINNQNENKIESANLKDRRYETNGDGNGYTRIDTHYTAKTKGNQQVDGIGDVNYDIPISDDSVAKNNQDLLEIFDQGINNIVLRIKARFGHTNGEVNKIVSSISSIFGNIDTIIQDNDRLGTDSLAENDYEHDGKAITRNLDGTIVEGVGVGKAVSKKDVLTGEYTSTISGKHKEETEMPTQFDYVKDIDKFKGNLDVDSNYDVMQGTKKLDLNDTNDREKLMTRLNNCQALEIFHLKLFENFMKTGAFTLTLYEKYKYITTVMLYLLKNLVNKPKLEKDCSNGATIPIADTVILPKTVIKNIGRLVEEQNRIQGTINTIDTALKQTKLDDVYGYASEAINENLKTKNSPNDKSVPNAETNDEVKKLTVIPPHVTNSKSEISDDDINISKVIQDPQPVANKPAAVAAAADP